MAPSQTTFFGGGSIAANTTVTWGLLPVWKPEVDTLVAYPVSGASNVLLSVSNIRYQLIEFQNVQAWELVFDITNEGSHGVDFELYGTRFF